LLRSAIASSDIALLSKCPGIGKKTAERIVIELKDKVFAEGVGSATTAIGSSDNHSRATHSVYQDAVASLMILGYKPADADKFVRTAASQLSADASVEELVKKALS
jgi:Holliday junction DNA helicase RuvA